MRFAFIEGRPDPHAVPVEGLLAAAQRILPQMPEQLILYPRSKGYLPLRQVAARRFADREGVPLPVDNIALTCGSSQALELIGRLFIRAAEKTPVITEALTYTGTLNLLRGLGADVIGVAADDWDGMDMEALEVTLQKLVSQGRQPGFIYTIATNQNPTGAILSEGRRRRLVALAQAYQVPIVEDDCYGDLIVDDIQVPPSLWRLDDSGSVFYVGSFSKIMGPGLRLGYVCASDRYLDKLLANRYDGGTSALAACMVAGYLEENLWSHISQVNARLREKRDVVLASLKAQLGDIATWTQPRGGLFIYIRLPESTDMARLRALATPQELDYTEGQRFDAANRELKAIRLSYAHVPPPDIKEGIRRLAACVRAAQLQAAVAQQV